MEGRSSSSREGTLDVISGKGETMKKMAWEAGKAYWLDVDPPGEQHADLNRGTTPIEVIVVEMRKLGTVDLYLTTHHGLDHIRRGMRGADREESRV